VSEDLAAFRERAARFLEGRLARRAPREQAAWGEGDDRISLFEEIDPEAERRTLDAARRWQRDLFDAGFGWIDGPAELGGAGLTAEHEAAFRALLAGFEAPDLRPLTVGLDIVAPAVLAHGDDGLKRRILPGLHRGELMACQLFSEPEAGSDLAAVRTAARRDGDAWVLHGHKVWTSGGHLADIGLALARTDPEAPKHAGLTMFLVGMRGPGVRVEPIRQMTGGASFNEVFLDGARVPDRDRVGAPGEGWRVALTTLLGERSSLGGEGGGPLPAGFVPRLRQLVAVLPEADDPLVRRDAERALMSVDAMRLTAERYGEQERRGAGGALNGVEGSVAKLLLVRALADTERLLTGLLGRGLVADDGSWGRFCWSEFVLGIPAFSIAGGTDDVQRNIVAERGLRLPKEGRAS
jgi:acyl-CoA dehydrogenase